MQERRVKLVWFVAALALLSAGLARAEAPAPSDPDPWVARPRVIVMTDIANEPDDQIGAGGRRFRTTSRPAWTGRSSSGERQTTTRRSS